MGIEAFAEAALALLPGWQIEAVEDINFLAPFKFYRNQPRTVTIKAMITQQGESVVADCRLIGYRTLPKQAEPEATTHFTGRVRLTRQAHAAVSASKLPSSEGAIVKASDIYRIYFHGPAYQVLNQAWLNGGVVGQMAQSLPSNHQPADRQAVLEPRLIELCFQTAGLWEISADGRMGLPLHVRQVRMLRATESASGPLYAVITPQPDGGTFDAEVVDTAGKVYLQLHGYQTIALPESVSGELLQALHAVA
jgi:hypothetical protein